ncbi:MAG: hypothetical protein AABX34_04720 [Nanoarchaeota archaeon]
MEASTLNIAANKEMDNSYLLEKKFEIMIGTATKKVLAEIAGLKESISALQNELNDVKRARPQSAPMPAASSPYSSAANIPQNTSNGSSNNHPSSTVARPRFGDYKPEDVSVDKFFYFGKK